jgi:hypothetical protein
MMHLCPKQLADGRWRYAAINSRGGGPIGYCADHQDEGHATSAEACECYRSYLVDRAMEHITGQPTLADDGSARELVRCEHEGCGALLTGHISLAGYRSAALCVDHRSREDVERVIGPVGESWES